MSRKHFSRTRIATTIAIILHVTGLVGILVFDNEFIIRCTPYNLLICFVLLLWTQRERNRAFILFTIAVCLLGFIIEVIGVKTGRIFGSYTYGNMLGPKFLGVPFMIGINWFVIIYSSGITTYTLLMRIIGRLAPSAAGPPKMIKSLSLLTDGATIATFFDWVMEPSAIHLDFWEWGNGGFIPWYNYFCWFIVSMLLLGIFNACDFRKRNKFAINLLLIQLMFFLVMRIYVSN